MDVRRVDLKALARVGAPMMGQTPLSSLSRLCEESRVQIPAGVVDWSVRGEFRAVEVGEGQIWLHLHAKTVLTQTCQRCMEAVQSDLLIDRVFRFVADEAQAIIEDEISEEDVLVFDRAFDLIGLIEDELLMALPLVPRHEVCPVAVPMSAQDADFDATQPLRQNPFAVLSSFKGMGGV